MDRGTVPKTSKIRLHIIIQKSIFLDVLRGMSILVGFAFGLILPILLRNQIEELEESINFIIPIWTIIVIYFSTHAVFIWVAYQLIKHKLHKRHNPAIDFLLAFVLGYVPIYLLIYLSHLLWILLKNMSIRSWF